jgi:hypothetical protein
MAGTAVQAVREDRTGSSEKTGNENAMGSRALARIAVVKSPYQLNSHNKRAAPIRRLFDELEIDPFIGELWQSVALTVTVKNERFWANSSICVTANTPSVLGFRAEGKGVPL